MPLVELAAIVRAAVFDRIDRAVDVAQQDGLAVDFDAAGHPFGYVTEARNGF
jgi:hypothetical protein